MWIVVEDGEIFEGNEKHWADCFFSNVDEKLVRDFCKAQGWRVVISAKRPTMSELDQRDGHDIGAADIERQAAQIACEYCGTTQEVLYIPDPFSSDVYNDPTLHHICNTCAGLRADEV